MSESTLTRRERGLRRWLMTAAIAIGLLVILVIAIVFYWLRFVLPTEPDPFTRGPWVASVAATRARIAWDAPAGTSVALRATAPDGRTLTAQGGVFTGLAPGTRYGWVANVGDQARAFGSVTTPPAAAGAPVRFITFGDYGAGGEDEWAVARVSAAQAPAFTASLGDNIYLAAAPVLFDRNLFRPLRPLLAQGPLLGVVGDHDTLWGGGTALANTLGWPAGGDRSVQRYGRIALITLGVEADPSDLPFLRTALAATAGADARFVIVHRPPAADNPILPVVRAAGVSAVLSGHNHRYERRITSGVLCLTVGTGGAPRSDGDGFTPVSDDAVRSLAIFGTLRVDVARGRVAYAFIDSAGRTRDRFAGPAR